MDEEDSGLTLPQGVRKPHCVSLICSGSLSVYGNSHRVYVWKLHHESPFALPSLILVIQAQTPC